MEDYELDPDKIINWAVNYAGYEDLQTAAKSLYSIYTVRRKKERPEEQRAARRTHKKYSKQGWQK